MKKSLTIPPLVVALTLLSVAPAGAIDFVKEVRPILEARCFECHGPESQKSSFRLDLREAAKLNPSNREVREAWTALAGRGGDELRRDCVLEERGIGV